MLITRDSVCDGCTEYSTACALIKTLEYCKFLTRYINSYNRIKQLRRQRWVHHRVRKQRQYQLQRQQKLRQRHCSDIIGRSGYVFETEQEGNEALLNLLKTVKNPSPKLCKGGQSCTAKLYNYDRISHFCSRVKNRQTNRMYSQKYRVNKWAINKRSPK